MKARVPTKGSDMILKARAEKGASSSDGRDMAVSPSIYFTANRNKSIDAARKKQEEKKKKGKSEETVRGQQPGHLIPGKYSEEEKQEHANAVNFQENSGKTYTSGPENSKKIPRTRC